MFNSMWSLNMHLLIKNQVLASRKNMISSAISIYSFDIHGNLLTEWTWFCLFHILLCFFFHLYILRINAITAAV